MNRNDLEIFIESIDFELDKIKNNEAYINDKSYFGLDKELLSYIRKLEQENLQLKGSMETYDILLKSNVEENKRLMQEIKRQEQAQAILDNQLAKLNSKIIKALEKIESYNLGKYDYSIPSIGIIELKEILGKSDKE